MYTLIFLNSNSHARAHTHTHTHTHIYTTLIKSYCFPMQERNNYRKHAVSNSMCTLHRASSYLIHFQEGFHYVIRLDYKNKFMIRKHNQITKGHQIVIFYLFLNQYYGLVYLIEIERNVLQTKTKTKTTNGKINKNVPQEHKCDNV